MDWDTNQIEEQRATAEPLTERGARQQQVQDFSLAHQHLGDQQLPIDGEAPIFLSETQVSQFQQNPILSQAQTELKSQKEIQQLTQEELVSAASLFKNSSQLQNERRISDLKKAQRKQISDSMVKTDKMRKREINLLMNKSNKNTEEAIRAVIIEGKNADLKPRKDVTGSERRKHASGNVYFNTSLSSTMEEDLDNLVNNMMTDLFLEGSFHINTDPTLNNIFLASEFLPMIHECDLLLGRQTEALKSIYKGDSSFSWNKELPFPEQSLSELVKQKAQVNSFQLLLKALSQNALHTYETAQSKLHAMELAREQLQSDNTIKKTAYTTKLISLLDKRIIAQQEKVNQARNAILNPSITDSLQAMRAQAGLETIRKLADIIKQIREDPSSKDRLLPEARALVFNHNCPLNGTEEASVKKAQSLESGKEEILQNYYQTTILPMQSQPEDNQE